VAAAIKTTISENNLKVVALVQLIVRRVYIKLSSA
jgi:hypothetical protein